MLQINSETAHKMFIQLMERFDKIEKMLERQNKMKECLDCLLYTSPSPRDA